MVGECGWVFLAEETDGVVTHWEMEIDDDRQRSCAIDTADGCFHMTSASIACLSCNIRTPRISRKSTSAGLKIGGVVALAMMMAPLMIMGTREGRREWWVGEDDRGYGIEGICRLMREERVMAASRLLEGDTTLIRWLLLFLPPPEQLRLTTELRCARGLEKG